MSNVGMAQRDALSNMSGGCAAPACDSTTLSTSPFCKAHQALSPSPGPGGGSSLKNSLPRVTHFSEARVVAKRGHNRSRIPSSGRTSVKPQASPSPNEIAKGNKALGSPVGTKYQSFFGPEKVEAQTKPNPVAPEDRSMSPPKDLNINGYQGQRVSFATNVLRFSNGLKEDGNVPASNISPPEMNHCAEISDQAILNSKVREEKSHSVSLTPERTQPTVSNPTSNGKEVSQGREDMELEDEGVEVSPLTPVQVSTQEPISNGQTPSKVVWANLPPPIQRIASPNSTDSGEMSDDEDEEPLIRSRLGKRRFIMMDHDDSESIYEPSSARESTYSQSPQILAQESGDEYMPMVPELPVLSPQHHDGSDSHSTVTSNSSHGNRPVVSTVITRSRVRSEARRAKRLAEFDSDAFDAMIQKQSELSPNVVSASPRSPRKVMAAKEDDRVALHVNPAIHGMHNRSEEWHQRKAKEIKSRGGRKAWFGKVHERQRYIHAKAEEAAKERERALRAGEMPPHRDPQPRVYKRTLDFGDIPMAELPEDVKKNKAWMKACAWHRATKSQPIQRQVPQRTAEEAQRNIHVQRATEEAHRFYLDALKSHGLAGKEKAK
ncbi:hypothetical protein BGZ61DRAFT_477662 [Ilyonectria robusta]|uniref:uncharacterized protein n=1 Tax=Ilyonectria robusta TaxID=1079257 RepID=UPI001E8E9F1F|nr:uncharacterized protein BGZ61DRAFT_477662 [Ilyonectria robusta]KAH8699688.1 hypothetical protein BGZ61DRAFT_477662 [Ilyonectria robusta]